jgi:hypothetical protein
MSVEEESIRTGMRQMADNTWSAAYAIIWGVTFVMHCRFRKSLGPFAFDFASYHPSTLSACAAVLLRKSRSATWTDIVD